MCGSGSLSDDEDVESEDDDDENCSALAGGISPSGSWVHTDMNCFWRASAFSVSSNVMEPGSVVSLSNGATPLEVLSLFRASNQKGLVSSLLVRRAIDLSKSRFSRLLVAVTLFLHLT